MNVTAVFSLLSPPLLADVAADRGPISLQGAVILLLVAAALLSWKAIADLRRRIDALEERPAPAATATAAPTAPAKAPVLSSTSSTDATPTEILAVIAAAVHVTLNGPHRIVGVRPVVSEPQAAWSMEGRRLIFASHKTR